MQALKIDWSQPGAPLSAAAHAALLVAILVGFASSPKLLDAQESIPVETITSSQFNEIMKGEKTAKALPTPQLKVDKVGPVELRKPAEPTPQAKLDVSAPPRLKPVEDPGDDVKLDPAPQPPPAEAAAVPVPVPKPAAVPVPVPKPLPAPAPQHSEREPVVRQSAPEARKTPTPDRPDAEVIEHAKPPKPVKAAAEPPAPPPKPHPIEKAAAKAKPDPQAKPDKPLKDQVAKLLDEKKLEELAAEPAPKPVDKPKKHHAKPRSGHTSDDALMGDIKQLLSKEAPQSTGSTGRKLTRVAALGAPTANAPRLSPFMMGALAELIKREYYKCWNNAGLEDGGYIPEFKIRFNRDWSVASTPALRNKPATAKQSAIARSALQAIMDQRCNPLPIPASYSRYYDDWKELPIGFNPSDSPSG